MIKQEVKYYSVAVDAPLWPDQLTYKYDKTIQEGSIVEIPLGKRKCLGVVIKECSQNKIENQKFEIKHIIGTVGDWKILEKEELALFMWTAKYYQYPLGKLIFDCLPNRSKKLHSLNSIKSKNKIDEFRETTEMLIAKDHFRKMQLNQFSQHLIHGVTGSGKSILYLNLMKDTLLAGKSILYLVPEINLTPQFVDFFSNYLNTEVYQFHSQINSNQKFSLYHHLKSKHQPNVVIAARSGVFLPSKNLGLIIIDEEHDQSYKQGDRCRYNARDVAIYKAKLNEIPIVLGSATPSLETYYRFTHFKELKSNYITLKKRYHEQLMPELHKVNEPHYTDINWPLSLDLIENIKATIENQKQVLIFVNKLGFSRYLQCKDCHHEFYCPNCSVKLNHFKKKKLISCHQCDYQEPIPHSCPKCGCLEIWGQGFGVEKIVESLEKYFSKKIILRIDRDEAKTMKEAKFRFEQFHQDTYKILVGTQMIAKGHNFNNVSLVIVLGIDAQLHSMDFRAKENVYQLLNQVGGRAGRSGDKSQLFIQSNITDEELNLYISGDFDSFYEEELKIRKLVSYPPYSKIVQIVLRGKNSILTKNNALSIANKIKATIKKNNLEVEIKGPKSTIIEKVKNLYGETILLISKKPELFSSILKPLCMEEQKIKGTTLSINVDPLHLD